MKIEVSFKLGAFGFATAKIVSDNQIVSGAWHADSCGLGLDEECLKTTLSYDLDNTKTKVNEYGMHFVADLDGDVLFDDRDLFAQFSGEHEWIMLRVDEGHANRYLGRVKVPHRQTEIENVKFERNLLPSTVI